MKKNADTHLSLGTKVPSTASFVVLLVTLWALNLADTYQTLYLKESGFLAREANVFIDFFLKEGRWEFLLAKVLALMLVTSILIRGWNHGEGIRLFRIEFSREQARAAMHFLLMAGVTYYIFIVGFPFIALLLSGAFTP